MKMKRIDIIRQKQDEKYELIDDKNGFLIFRKRFSIGWFLFWLICTYLIGGFIYLVYHLSKKKVYIEYKQK